LAPLAIKAPNTDFNFLLNLIDYKEFDADISNAALKKFKNHLWYLAPENAAFAIFDDDVPLDIKQKISDKMKTIDNSDCDNQIERYMIKNEDLYGLKTKDISYFITADSKAMFSRFNIHSDFLNNSPSTWKENENFQRGMELLKRIVVVNDVAERGVKLIQEYNSILSKDETEKQYIVQIVSEYRKQYPDSTKTKLMKK